MQLNMRDRRMRLLGVLLLLSLPGGCGSSDRQGPSMGDVTGTVKYQEKPVVGATIVFLPSKPDTPVGAAVTDAGGRYKLAISGRQKGAIVGPYRITIVLNALFEGTPPPGMSLGSAQESIPGKPLIPEKYFNPATSGLTAEVKPGSNKFDFALQD